ncbi:hypothetical protein JCM5353_005117 [Sporobolomyces roseus]
MIASLALVASLAIASVQAAPIALNLVEASVSTPNSTYSANVSSYTMSGNAGACTWYNKDSDKVVGLPLEFYTELSTVSPYCGSFVVVKSLQTNESVTALVADASTQNKTLSVSQGTWAALNGTASDLKTVEWRFANETETAAAKAALKGDDSESSSSYIAPSSTSQYVAPSSSSSAYVAPSSSSSVAAVQNQRQAAPSSSSYVEKKTSSSTKAYVAPTTTYAPKTTTTSQYVAPKTTTQAQSSGGGGSYSGRATFYDQGGAAGSCGSVHSDSDYIVAMSSSFGGYNSFCGRSVHISYGGKSINAVVADTCPGCGSGSLDLSRGAFAALGSYDQGVLPISWSFN